LGYGLFPCPLASSVKVTPTKLPNATYIYFYFIWPNFCAERSLSSNNFNRAQSNPDLVDRPLPLQLDVRAKGTPIASVNFRHSSTAFHSL